MQYPRSGKKKKKKKRPDQNWAKLTKKKKKIFYLLALGEGIFGFGLGISNTTKTQLRCQHGLKKNARYNSVTINGAYIFVHSGYKFTTRNKQKNTTKKTKNSN